MRISSLLTNDDDIIDSDALEQFAQPISVNPLLEQSALAICKALAKNPKQYDSKDYYWLGNILVTDKSPKVQRHRKEIWLKRRHTWKYTPNEMSKLPYVEQGKIALQLIVVL